MPCSTCRAARPIWRCASRSRCPSTGSVAINILPTFIEPSEPELIPISAEIEELATPLWILTHPDLRRTARIQAFMQLVGDSVARRAELQRE